MDDLKMLGAVLALVTAPACGYLSMLVKTLYSDLKESRAENVELLREMLETVRTLKNGHGKPGEPKP